MTASEDADGTDAADSDGATGERGEAAPESDSVAGQNSGTAGHREAGGEADAASAGETVVVLNPTAGSGSKDRVRDLAAERGYRVVETEGPGDAERLAREAADGASTVVAAGGDGTVHQVVNGLAKAEALGAVTFGVVPAGTGNNFAGNVGITGVEQAFDVLADGEVRHIDLGSFEGEVADGPPSGVFVNSCIGGVTAEASGETTTAMKRRYGALAYVVATLRTMVAFEPLPLTVAAGDGRESWSGEAAFVLVGNGRRFPVGGQAQGHVEDGLLEVTIAEEMPARDLIGEAALQRLFGRETPHVTRLRTPTVDLSVRDDEAASFSLDGEMGDFTELSLGVRKRALRLAVGPGYKPNPDVEDGE